MSHLSSFQTFRAPGEFLLVFQFKSWEQIRFGNTLHATLRYLA